MGMSFARCFLLLLAALLCASIEARPLRPLRNGHSSPRRAGAGEGEGEGAQRELLRVRDTGNGDIDGQFDVIVKGKTWLRSGSIYVRHEGQVCSPENGKLVLTESHNISGHDTRLGDWEGVLYQWQVQVGDKPPMYTVIRKFATGNLVLLDQHFTEEVTGTQTDGRDCASPYIPHGGLPSDGDWLGLSAAYPTFTRKAGIAEEQLAFLEFSGKFINGINGGSGPNLGQWDDPDQKHPITPGLTAGPFALFDQQGNVAIISSHSNFMSASVDTNVTDRLDFGIMGGAESIPAGFHISHALFVSDKGINHAFEEWGANLLAYYGKPSTRAQEDDVTNKYLAYTTDNGAFYYYYTEGGKNYYETLMDVHNYSVSEGIPYRNVLLDSWWYYQDPKDGSVTLWEAREDIFPGGNAGMNKLLQETGWKSTAHNRYWSNSTKYDVLNGGSFEFVHDLESNCDQGEAISVPGDEKFWDFLFQQATNEWGLATYEQDWLWPQFMSMTHMMSNVSLGRDWLMQMGNMATKHNVNIQYCMPLPRHTMQSVEIPAVTQIRASDDYGPTNRWWQWRIGRSSIFANALGLAPSKDGIYTTRMEPGGSQGNFIELRPELETCVATMSTGPVQIADGIGYSDVELIMRSCMKDGTLLKPSKAMTAMDFALIDEAFGRTRANYPDRSEIWGTYSVIGEELWFHVLAADLQQETVLELQNVLAMTPPGASAGVGEDEGTWLAYWIPALDFDVTRLSLVPLSATNANNATITLEKKLDKEDFDLWHFARVMDNGVSILGELTKWVPMSANRVQEVRSEGNTVQVLVKGAALERVTFYFAQQNQQVSSQSCTIPSGSDNCLIVYTMAT